MRPRAGWMAVILGTALLAAACGGDDPGDATGVDANGSASTSTSSSVVMPHGMGPPPTGADGSVPATVVLPQSPLGPWSLDAEASDGFPSAGGAPAALVAVRTSEGEGTQRIVFEFDGDTAPGWQVGYEPLPVVADPTGEPVELTGTTALVVRMTPASTVDLTDGSFTPIYDGPERLPVEGGTPAVELMRTGDFEGLLTWAVGVEARVPFAVDTLTSPARLVIDLLATGP